jgi:hypothetical protein
MIIKVDCNALRVSKLTTVDGQTINLALEDRLTADLWLGPVSLKETGLPVRRNEPPTILALRLSY